MPSRVRAHFFPRAWIALGTAIRFWRPHFRRYTMMSCRKISLAYCYSSISGLSTALCDVCCRFEMQVRSASSAIIAGRGTRELTLILRHRR